MSSHQTYSTFATRQLVVLPGFIISGHDLKNIRYSDNRMLFADTEKETAATHRESRKGHKKGLSIEKKNSMFFFFQKENKTKYTN